MKTKFIIVAACAALSVTSAQAQTATIGGATPAPVAGAAAASPPTPIFGGGFGGGLTALGAAGPLVLGLGAIIAVGAIGSSSGSS